MGYIYPHGFIVRTQTAQCPSHGSALCRGRLGDRAGGRGPDRAREAAGLDRHNHSLAARRRFPDRTDLLHEQGWAYNIAYVFAYRRETGRAFEWLDRAVEYKDAGLSNILSERLFSDIQDDPRWLVFLESIGKSPEQLAAIEFKVTLPE